MTCVAKSRSPWDSVSLGADLVGLWGRKTSLKWGVLCKQLNISEAVFLHWQSSPQNHPMKICSHPINRHLTYLPGSNSFIFSIKTNRVCVWMCVSVCVRERETERDYTRQGPELGPLNPNWCDENLRSLPLRGSPPWPPQPTENSPFSEALMLDYRFHL